MQNPNCSLDTGPGKPVSVNSNVNQGSDEGPGTLASKPSCPVLTHCIHTVGSRPSGTANRRANKACPSLHGPACSDVESLAATPSPVKKRTTLTNPTTAAGSRRPPALCRASLSTGGACSVRTSPKAQQRRLPAPRSPWLVRHRNSGRNRPHAWHQSRLHWGTIPQCRHGERFPFHRCP